MNDQIKITEHKTSDAVAIPDERMVMEHDARFGKTGYIVEANDYEYSTLWFHWHDRVKWKQDNWGLLIQVGELAKKPVSFSARWAVIESTLVLFYHPTSQVVDHAMIEKWLDDNCNPMLDDNRKARTDASNFHNLIRYCAA